LNGWQQKIQQIVVSKLSGSCFAAVSQAKAALKLGSQASRIAFAFSRKLKLSMENPASQLVREVLGQERNKLDVVTSLR
jgi:hypothetical protein